MKKTILRYICIVADLHVPVNTTKQFSVAMRTLHWIMFSLFRSYKIFHTAVKNINFHSYKCKVRDIFVRFMQI